MPDFDRYQWALAQPGDWFSVRVVTDPKDVNPQEIALTRKELLAGLTCGQVPTPPPPTVTPVRMQVVNPTGVNKRSAMTPKDDRTIIILLKRSELVTVDSVPIEDKVNGIIWRKVIGEQAYIAEKTVNGAVVWLAAPN